MKIYVTRFPRANVINRVTRLNWLIYRHVFCVKCVIDQSINLCRFCSKMYFFFIVKPEEIIFSNLKEWSFEELVQLRLSRLRLSRLQTKIYNTIISRVNLLSCLSSGRLFFSEIILFFSPFWLFFPSPLSQKKKKKRFEQDRIN